MGIFFDDKVSLKMSHSGSAIIFEAKFRNRGSNLFGPHDFLELSPFKSHNHPCCGKVKIKNLSIATRPVDNWSYSMGILRVKQKQRKQNAY